MQQRLCLASPRATGSSILLGNLFGARIRGRRGRKSFFRSLVLRSEIEGSRGCGGEASSRHRAVVDVRGRRDDVVGGRASIKEAAAV